MSFAMPIVLVAPTGSSVATTGSTEDLTGGKIGVYRPDWTVATSGNAAAATYLRLAQGRKIKAPGEGSIKSDAIYKSNIIEWYKVVGETTAKNQIWDITDLTAGCDESISLTIRAHSFYIDTAYFNGLTRSVQALTPCCDCGEDPCATLDASAVEDVMEELRDKINADELLKRFFIAETLDTGLDTKLRIHAKALEAEQTSVNPNANPFMYDMVNFKVFVYKGAPTSNDYLVEDRCEPVATTTEYQNATYPRLLADDVKQAEKDSWSYMAAYKHLFDNPDFNGEFYSNVDATVYDLYIVKFRAQEDNGFNFMAPINETVHIYVPQGSQIATDILTILTAAWGAPANSSPADVTTTTTTSTTTTTTTT